MSLLLLPPQRQLLGPARPQTAIRARQRPQRRPRQDEVTEAEDGFPTRELSDGFSAEFALDAADVASRARYGA